MKMNHRIIGPCALRRVRAAVGLFFKEAKDKFSIFNRIRKISGVSRLISEVIKCKESISSFQYGCLLMRQAINDMFQDIFSYIINEDRPEFKSIPDISRQRE